MDVDDFADALALAAHDVVPFLELYGAWLSTGARFVLRAALGAIEFAFGAAFVTERLALLRVA
jgi:hypothetical protein